MGQPAGCSTYTLMMPLLLCPLGTNSCRADRRIMLRFEGEDVVMMRMQTSHGALPAPVTERGPVDGTIRGDTRCRGEDRRRHNFGGTRCGGGAMHTRREKSRETQALAQSVLDWTSDRTIGVTKYHGCT